MTYVRNMYHSLLIFIFLFHNKVLSFQLELGEELKLNELPDETARELIADHAKTPINKIRITPKDVETAHHIAFPDGAKLVRY